MGWFKRRLVPGNTHSVRALVAVPDAWSIQAASLVIMTHTLSPGAAGRHGGSRFQFTGDPGYGVNRAAGRTIEPIQTYSRAAAPVLDPLAKRLGTGAGVAGQPGLPGTGDGSISSPLAWMSLGPMGRAGMGG